MCARCLDMTDYHTRVHRAVAVAAARVCDWIGFRNQFEPLRRSLDGMSSNSSNGANGCGSAILNEAEDL